MVCRNLCFIVASAALTAGCGWGVQATVPSAEVEVTSAPVEIESAPQVVYEGRPTYYYGNRWYYREGTQWRAYRNEPSGLVEHRRRFQAQPAAVRREAPRQQGPGHQEERHEERH